jgi:hypothetical protein
MTNEKCFCNCKYEEEKQNQKNFSGKGNKKLVKRFSPRRERRKKKQQKPKTNRKEREKFARSRTLRMKVIDLVREIKKLFSEGG